MTVGRIMSLRLVLFCGLALTLLRCSLNDAAKKIGDSAVAASANLKEGAEAIGRIDPVALNKLLADNESSRKLVADLERKLAIAQNFGVVSVDSASEVWLEIADYSGGLRIDGWLDREENKFMDNIPLPATDIELPIQKDLISRRVETIAAKWFGQLPVKVSCFAPSFNTNSFNATLPFVTYNSSKEALDRQPVLTIATIRLTIA